MSRFQTFDESTSPANGAERIKKLRAELARRGYDGYIVPRADEHQGEYVPPSAARLAWLTGFTGSAGTAVILRDKAALIVDGRYTVQAAAQVDPSVITPVQMADTPAECGSRGTCPRERSWLTIRGFIRQTTCGGSRRQRGKREPNSLQAT